MGNFNVFDGLDGLQSDKKDLLNGISLDVRDLKDEINRLNKWEVGPKGSNSKEKNSEEKVEETTKFLMDVLQGGKQGRNAVNQGLRSLVNKRDISQEDEKKVIEFFDGLENQGVVSASGNVNKAKLKQLVLKFKEKDLRIFALLKEAMPPKRG